MLTRKKLKTTFFIITILALVFLISQPVFAGGFATWNIMSSSTTVNLNGIWGVDNSHIFAIGESGTIIYYDGSTWSHMASGTTEDLCGIWGTDSNQVLAVGESGTIVNYTGSAWSSMNSGTTNNLSGIWGTSEDDIFAAGSAGTIIHYDGTAWNPMSSGITEDLYGIWGTDGENVFAAGQSGTIIYYDGSTWIPMSTNTSNDLHGIWGANGNDIFAAGSSGTIIHFDGSSWSSLSSDTTGNLYAIWGTAGNDVFAAGDSGIIVHYDGTSFSSMNRNTIKGLRAIQGFSGVDIFAAGASGTILRYVPPVINSLSISQGNQGETLSITINGTNFTGANEVRLGPGIAVNGFTVINSNQISANISIVASAETGSRDVSVTTSGGSYTLPSSFTVQQALPTITLISPDRDKQGSTLNVTITGANLTGTTGVQFGTGIAVNSFNVLSANQITANISIVSDTETGPRDVSVITSGGRFTLPDSFTVGAASPVINSISPILGNQETTFNITIDGKNFTGASGIQLGTGIVINSFTVLNSNQVSANISIEAGAEIGTRDVSVTTPGGNYTLPNSFTVKQALPIINSISPDNGSQGATLDVTITGTNFTGTREVQFGTGITVNSMDVFNTGKIKANITIVSGADTGARDIVVTTPGGSFALPGSFAVKQGPPVITSISPDQGSRGATLTVIISGSNLSGATSVSFGTGATVQKFTNLSPTQISAALIVDEDAVIGARDVSVITPGGRSTLSNSFEVKEKSTATLFIALLWVIIAVVIVLFIIILNILRKNRGLKG